MQLPKRLWIFIVLAVVALSVLLFDPRTSAPMKPVQPELEPPAKTAAPPESGARPQMAAPHRALAPVQNGKKIVRASGSTLQTYPDAEFVDGAEAFLTNGEIHRVELIKTSMKYPFVRVERRFHGDSATGREVTTFLHEAVATHVVIELRQGASTNELTAALAAIEGKIMRKIPVDYADTFIIALPKAEINGIPNAIASLSRFSEVIKLVDADTIGRLQLYPNDYRFFEMWGLEDGNGNNDIEATDAWELQTGNASVTVAVLDSGIDNNHPDLVNRLWRNQAEVNGAVRVDDDGNGYIDDRRGWNFFNDSPNQYDVHGHGTHVAGIIGAQGNNSIGTVGVCWDCRLMALNVADFNGAVLSTDMIPAYDYARRMGAKIINASLVINRSEIEASAINNLQSHGVMVVAAAGNAGQDIDTQSVPKYPAAYPNLNIISVGFTDQSSTLDSYSNYGASSVDLLAPGRWILSTVPYGYDFDSGSSMAAPHVAGVAALLKAQNPGWSYLQIRSAILNNVDVRPQLEGKCVTRGMLNAFKAVAPKVPLTTALDNNFVWSTGGDAPWMGRKRSLDGYDIAESGGITNGQESWLETTVTGPGVLSFLWSVSSERYYDQLKFSINGTAQQNISGNVDWTLRNYTVGHGTYTFRWSFSKNDRLESPKDRGALDQVSFTAFLPSTPTNVSALPLGLNTAKVSWRRASTNTHEFAISRSTSPTGPFTTIALAERHITNIFDTVRSGLTYYYVVKAWSSHGFSTNSAPAMVTMPVGMEDNLLFQNPSGRFSVWVMNHTNLVRSAAITSGPGAATGWRVAASADFNMDLWPDILWQHTNGAVSVWLMRSTNLLRSVPLRPGPAANTGWSIVSAPDLTGDTKPDLLWRNSPSGALMYWHLNGTNYLNQFSLGTGLFSAWNAVGTGDLNDDGHSDIVWSHQTGANAVWLMNRTNFIVQVPLRAGYATSTGWKLSTMMDLNVDRKVDLIWEHNDGRLEGWLMNGTSFTQKLTLPNNTGASTGWRLIGPQ
jgi:subtilisin family serine protease